ncbi:hypothetical protein [Streptococcus danieliae]|uniref:hypothetical protein n=1 Tax=Streptococcus danieliae TaxID=747656 RepID=UPI0021C937ED|nr:hypothetical protein [Streptococcus danieliae]
MTLAVLFMLGFFRLFNMSIIGVYTQQLIIVAFSTFMCLHGVLIQDPFLRKENAFLNRYFIFYSIFLLMVGSYSSSKYGYTVEMMFKQFYLPYLLPFSAYGLIFIFHKDRSLVPFLSLVSKIVIFMLGMRMLSWGLYSYGGILIFPNLLFQYEGWIRDGFQRVEAGMLFGIALSYLTVQAMEKNIRGLVYKLLLIFMVIFLLLVTRVRFQSILAIVSIVAPFIIARSESRGSLILKIMSLSLGMILLFFNYQSIVHFLSELIGDGAYAASSTVRLDGINHYFSLMVQEKAYFGLGYLNPSNPIVGILMARNAWSIYYIDDLGLLGSVVQFGLFTIVTHLLLFIQAIKVLFKSRKISDTSYFAFLLSLTIYMIGSQILLNMFDKQRIFDVPFYLATYSFLDVNLSSNNTDFAFTRNNMME